MTVPRYNACTIWTEGKVDPLTGKKGEGIARVYRCERRQGGSTKLVDSTGSEFYPSSTFWVRESDLISGTHSIPRAGEMIANGEHDDGQEIESGAEIVRGVTVHDNTKFRQPESYTIGVK